MKKVAVMYATREGHARKVADRIAGALIARDLEVAVHHVADDEAAAAVGLADANVLVASVHASQHERAMIDFVNTHPIIRERPGTFVSVCLSEAQAENDALPPSERAAAARKVQEQVRLFLDATHWRPAHVHPVAGALLYTHYNVLVRWMMHRVAKQAKLPTDTTHDFELTNWGALDAFAARLAAELHETEAA